MMDDMLTDDDGNPGCMGMRCGPLAWFVVALSVLFLVMIGGAGGAADSTPSVNSSTHEALSRNQAMSNNQLMSQNQVELMSRNQVNILSNPQNCWGDGSCPQFNITTSNEIRTTGDNNVAPVMVAPNGSLMCYDPTLKTWNTSACQGYGGK